MRVCPAPGLRGVALVILLGCSASSAAWAGPAEDGNAGMEALAKGDYYQAIRMFTRSLKSGGLSREDREFAYSERGKAYLGKGDRRAAVADLRIAVKMRPDDQDAQHQLELAQAQNPAGATPASAQPVAENAGNDASTGMTALTNGDYPRAVQLFTRAINAGTLNRDDTELAFVSRGKAYLQQGDARSAAVDLNRALAINPNDQDAATPFFQALIRMRPRVATAPINGATCNANSSSTGSFFSGKVLQAWAAYPTLTPLDAFAGAYAYLENNQWNVSGMDLTSGSISATQPVPGDPTHTIDMNIRIEAAGAGSKTTAVENIRALTIALDPKGKLCNLLASVPSG